ncbi:unnamed protein product [Rotaria socialis]|uniref:Uncharacterized protein n=1 Tax=Rotaria socialis TaxID=392032 RepID=A0A820W0S1_9BILA|nr:unnamed protein product [Rotaria socialis]CAF3344665.1 unnamed protein product [Rotaria socialis]CAF4508962.1 unnamed protein product [Rotaria socialis]CAF4645169.1 unnamed protein product [Rotaria socialis]
MQLLVLVLFYFELHSQLGNYDTIRTPKQGRDFDYRYSSYDLYLVGATNEIYRFNLKQGQYLESLSSKLMVKNLTSIEPGTPLNHMLNIPGTGTICLTNTLGNAPKWCTFLDNITEEFEEKPADTVYNDYKFLTLN